MLGDFVDVHGRWTNCYSIRPPQQWKVGRLKLGGNVAVAREVSTKLNLHETFVDTWSESRYHRV